MHDYTAECFPDDYPIVPLRNYPHLRPTRLRRIIRRRMAWLVEKLASGQGGNGGSPGGGGGGGGSTVNGVNGAAGGTGAGGEMWLISLAEATGSGGVLFNPGLRGNVA